MKPNNNIAPLSETPALIISANAGLGLDTIISGIGGNLIYTPMKIWKSLSFIDKVFIISFILFAAFGVILILKIPTL